jgi:hypothetical protein
MIKTLSTAQEVISTMLHNREKREARGAERILFLQLKHELL